MSNLVFNHRPSREKPKRLRVIKLEVKEIIRIINLENE
jgi:hypothetical protein